VRRRGARHPHRAVKRPQNIVILRTDGGGFYAYIDVSLTAAEMWRYRVWLFHGSQVGISRARGKRVKLLTYAIQGDHRILQTCDTPLTSVASRGRSISAITSSPDSASAIVHKPRVLSLYEGEFVCNVAL
jgi:hypothetical protein